MSNDFSSPVAAPIDRLAPRWLQVMLFLLLYALFHWAYQSLRGSSWDDAFIHQFTARPAAWLLELLDPGQGVKAVGYRLIWPGGGLALRAGCDGFEVMGLFVAAMLVADVSWQRGLPALVGGCLVIWVLNQWRIAALYAAVRYDRSWFDALHTVWGPLVLIAAVAGLYTLALRRPRGAAGC